MSNIAEKA